MADYSSSYSIEVAAVAVGILESLDDRYGFD